MDLNEAYKRLFIHINEIVPINESEFNSCKKSFEFKKFKKKEFLLEPGQISKHMRFIASGCARVYYIDDDGAEKTLQVGIENWWINDLYSYTSQKESTMYIQAIENTCILQISRNDLEMLYLEQVAISNFFRIKIQRAYTNLQERTIENMSSDAYSRYSKFIKEYRNIEQRIPQYIVASYLGVTPEFLSYLRNKHKS